eukprot:scaffold63836_cov30-Tisochrysis_lutea.AAC.1
MQKSPTSYASLVYLNVIYVQASGLQAVNYYSPLRGHAQISRYGLASAACVVVVVVCVCAISPLWAPGFGASLAEPRASLTTLKRSSSCAS